MSKKSIRKTAEEKGAGLIMRLLFSFSGRVRTDFQLYAGIECNPAGTPVAAERKFEIAVKGREENIAVIEIDLDTQFMVPPVVIEGRPNERTVGNIENLVKDYIFPLVSDGVDDVQPRPVVVDSEID